jgi:hypothetical protein
MSELMHPERPATGLRGGLLVTVSAMALVACVLPAIASGTDDDRPTVWIDLGGQLERVDGTGRPFAPDFATTTPTPEVFEPISPIDAQHSPRYSYGGEGRLSIMPEGTDWVLSAGVRYGRSNGGKYIQNQLAYPRVKNIQRLVHYPSFSYSKTQAGAFAQFNETRTKQSESHTILDFKAGKDIGIGLFGDHSTSQIAAGIRFAQFASRATSFIRARPDLEFYNGFAAFNTPSFYFYKPYARFHAYTQAGSSTRSFHGIGPSLSWEGSSPIAGNADSAQLALDWGADFALLFGRQKASVTHQTTLHSFHQRQYPRYQTLVMPGGHNNRRSVVVPNLGAFAGLSVNFPNSKVSFGYRGDYFFGAMDTGIDARHSQNVSFHGPFAKISIGF